MSHATLDQASNAALLAANATIGAAAGTEYLHSGLSSLTAVCAIIGATTAVLGLALKAWIHLPQIVANWKWVKGKPVTAVKTAIRELHANDFTEALK